VILAILFTFIEIYQEEYQEEDAVPAWTARATRPGSIGLIRVAPTTAARPYCGAGARPAA